METLPKQQKSEEQKPIFSRGRRLAFWLLVIGVSIALVLTVALLAAEYVLSTPAIKVKIQQLVTSEVGVKIDYEKIGMNYFPTLTVEVDQLSFSQDQVQGKADVLRVSPRIAGFLTGKLDLGMVELERPDIDITLAEPESVADPDNDMATPSPDEGQLFDFTSLFQAFPAFKVNIVDGHFSLVSGSRKLVGEHVNLTLVGAIESTNTGQAELEMGLAELKIQIGDQQETIKNIALQGKFRATNGDIHCQFGRLAIVEPALKLSGEMASSNNGTTLKLSGTDLDVDAIRKTALALAGDVSPIPEIFTYLVGGTIPQITFSAKGEKVTDLGDLKNILIKGNLQKGAVSIPEIEMDLTEVNGDVVIENGVLSGTNLLARLEGSTAHSGMLKMGITEESDLFQMELLLSADLSQLQAVLKRIVGSPDFSKEVDRITQLKGNGGGKLVLGDTLANIHATFEDNGLNFSFNHEMVPFPITITHGSVKFTKNQLALTDVSATVGKSEISGMDCAVNWQQNVHLDVNTKHSSLSLDDLFPWLSSLKSGKQLRETFKSVTGVVDLSAATFKGDLAAPKKWKYTAEGALRGVKIVSTLFPKPVTLTKGNVQLDGEKLRFKQAAVKAFDANLVVSGAIGLSSAPAQHVDVTVDGLLGEHSVAWLEDTFSFPKAYAVKTPVTLKSVKIASKIDKSVKVIGGMTVKNGPKLTLDVLSQPGELKVNNLTIKDQYSDVTAHFALTDAGALALGFSGSLHSETLAGLFVANPEISKGALQGNFTLDLPQKGTTTNASAKGQLKGENLSIPIPSGDTTETMLIKQIALELDGRSGTVEAAELTWSGYTWNPISATIDMSEDIIRVDVSRAELCGINSPGVLTIDGEIITLDTTFTGKNLDAASNYGCLRKGKINMTGTADITSHLKTNGKSAELLKNLNGPLTITMKDGVILQDEMLSETMDVLNVTEAVEGRLPDLKKGGFKYDIITIEGELKDGKLLFDKLFMDGELLDVLGYGELDIEKGMIDVELLASPFTTVNSIIRHIPGLNYLMGGTLVTIPVRINGQLDSPDVSIMSPSSVSKSLLNLGERTIKLPFKMIEAIIPTGTKEKESSP